MKKVDYIAIMQGYCGSNNHGFLTDEPRPRKLSDDDYVKVRYDAKAMRWIHSRPSIKYPTAKELIKEYRREFAEKLG